MQHNYTQQLVFLGWLNKVLDNEFLSLELRQRLQGVDLATKRFLQDLPRPDLSKKQANELLFTYINRMGLRSRNLQNIIEDLEIKVESREDIDYLNEQLQKSLEILGLPDL